MDGKVALGRMAAEPSRDWAVTGRPNEINAVPLVLAERCMHDTRRDVLQLSAAGAIAADEPWDRPDNRTEQPRSATLQVYGARRWHICQEPFAPYGFGPPMTRPGAELWTCQSHRDELRQALILEPGRRPDPTQTRFL